MSGSTDHSQIQISMIKSAIELSQGHDILNFLTEMKTRLRGIEVQ